MLNQNVKCVSSAAVSGNLKLIARDSKIFTTPKAYQPPNRHLTNSFSLFY